MAKRVTLLVLIAVVLGGASTVTAQWDPNTDPSLIGWWSFDEGTGTAANDSSAGGHDGAVNGNALWVAGRFGDALQFNGSNARVVIPHIPLENRSFTITMWINPVLYTAEQVVFSTGLTGANDTDMHFRLGGPGAAAGNAAAGGARMGFYNNDLDTPGGFIVDNKWCHLTFWYDYEHKNRKIYINGVQRADQASANPYLGTTGDVVIGAWGTGQWFRGIIDDVRIFKRALTLAEIKALVPPVVKATNPNPANGTVGLMMPLLTWTPGETAATEDVYLGDTPELTEANRVSTHQSILYKMYYHVAPPLVPGKTYYWRIDAVELSGTVRTGDVWSFSMAPTNAFSPSPRNGDKWIDPNVDLSWKPGQNATKHALFFGTDRAKVEARDASVSKGTLAIVTYEPGTLAKDTTYYWAVDESGAGNYAGEVWRFTTAGGPGGVKGQYFANTSRDVVGAPVLTRIDSSIDFAWGDASPDSLIGIDHFSVRWTADLEIAVADTYTFITNTDDGARVWLNDQRIINQWVDQAPADATSAGIPLEPGIYPLMMEYYEWEGGAVAYLYWQTPSIARQIIPPGALQPPVRARVMYPQDGDVNVPYDSTLMWSIGEKTVTHQVYLGTDQAAVEAATTADTAIYKGSQGKDENTLTPGNLEFNTTYYWRVDEVNDGAIGSPWKGSVWSFTTADFIIVDSFETYTNDSPNRIFQTWIDGYGFSEDEFFPNGDPGNGTGSAVGHDIWAELTQYTDIVETSIVRPGSTKSMPLGYNNADSPFNSEAVRTWESPQNWTLNDSKILSLQVYGYRAAPTPVAVTETGGKMNLTGAGADIWGTSDEFTFAYKTLSGDGTLIAKVVNNGTGNNTWTKGGVMIRDSLEGGSASAQMVLTGGAGNGGAFQNRATAGLDMGANDTTSNLTLATAITLPYWVKIERTGDTFTGSISSDGAAWVVVNTVDVVMTAPVYIGLCVTSHDPNVDRTFQFEGIKSTGGVTGQWQGAVIDSPAWNSPQDFYVVLQDSLGKSFVVSNATAVNSGDWLDVQIPLSQFTGVNPAKIKKMTIGVGKRTNPVADGSGELFIDDIRVIKLTP